MVILLIACSRVYAQYAYNYGANYTLPADSPNNTCSQIPVLSYF